VAVVALMAGTIPFFLKFDAPQRLQMISVMALISTSPIRSRTDGFSNCRVREAEKAESL
jgi:hypothetical protein